VSVFSDDDSTNIVCNNAFLSVKRRKLVGLFSVIGTPNYAFVYSLLYDCRLISSFSYAIETSQVRRPMFRYGNHVLLKSNCILI